MKPSDRDDLEAVLAHARHIRDTTGDLVLAEILDRWIRRDEGRLSDMAAISLLELNRENDTFLK